MDIDADEELTFSDDFDDEMQNQGNVPWQFGLTNLDERVWALFRNASFTDITLTFPGKDITFDVHRLILAITSPVFEGILYGPMRAEGRNVELHGDDPLIMEYVIAHCYGAVHLEIPDMDMALELYKLADKYILDELKYNCAKLIVSKMSKDNIKDVHEFAERFDFTDLKYNCLHYLKEMFENTHYMYGHPQWREDEPDYAVTSTILMDLNDDWIGDLLPEVDVNILDFNESWKHPESTLRGNRLSTILSSRCYLDKFYGCINAENIHQFPLEHIGRNSKTLELCLSVTDPHHAKSVIEAINLQDRFEKHLIAIHIRCEEVWPINWSSIPTERTHRPSILLISDADDDKAAWVIEAAKSLLPQSEGSYTKAFRKYRYDDDNGYKHVDTLKTINILKLPRSRFTLNGFITMVQGLITSGVKFKKIICQSSCISNAEEIVIQQFNLTIQCLPMDNDFFQKVFEDFPISTEGFIEIAGLAVPQPAHLID